MEFKSQICTTKPQSEALLALGLKKETADMYYARLSHGDQWDLFIGLPLGYDVLSSEYLIPAWSLHRLMEMYGDNYNYIWFQNAYNELIHAISISIEDATFNKDYLEEKK